MSQLTALYRRPHLEALEDRMVLDTTAFVRGLYATILQRTGSASEVQGWVNLLSTGLVTKNQVTQQFLLSQEHVTLVVNHDFTTYLGRNPDAAGGLFWSTQIANGLPEEDFVADLVGSQEFVNLHQDGSVGAWLNDTYLTLLGRGVDGGGLAFWSNAFAAGANLAQVASGILHSVEAETSFVNAAYQTYLNRSADAAGQQVWLNLLAFGATRYTVIIGFCGSQEFENIH